MGESEWSAAYLGAALAGTAGDVFPPESYASLARPRASRSRHRRPPTTGATVRRLRAGRPGRAAAEARAAAWSTPTTSSGWAAGSTDPGPQTQAPQKTAERIERRMRLRVTASDVDATAQHLWSRSLESERERRVTDRHALTGGSLKTIRGHVSRDLDREIAHEMEQQVPRPSWPRDRSDGAR